MTLDLIFFSTLLRLVIWTLDNSMNFDLFLLLIGIMTCFLDGPSIIMFNFGLDLLSLLIILKIKKKILPVILEKFL